MIATTGDASAKAAAGGSSRRENEEAARLKHSFFVSLMEMPVEQFKSLQEEDARARREAKRGTTATSRRKTAGIVEALDLPEGSVVTRPNSYISVSYLRDLFRCFPWLDLRGIAVMSNLLHSKVLCKLCYLETAGSGVFDCNKATLEEHATSKLHQDKIAKSHKRQLDLLQAGAVHASVAAQQVAARQLVVGHLVAGTDGFAGIPYSRITEVLSPDVLTVHAALRSGIPSSRTSRETDLPALVKQVKRRIATVSAQSATTEPDSSRPTYCRPFPFRLACADAELRPCRLSL